MRFFRLTVILLCICAVAMPDDSFAARKRHGAKRAKQAVSLGVDDPRYAAVIMDPITGEILHERNGNTRRYPASLTKMMTLYMLFDALEQGKISLDDDMEVSSTAFNQPQTNINLQPGDEVPVDLAIKATVVRSANDVAVVIAEKLGGSQWRFAQMMNTKALALGMRGSHFKNPNGLPDEDQYTTARDMAKLGIALKRDFPQYYPYFSTREFSWNGVTYYTHNRVMLRYSGVDGIKTGYIGKSGFNVVSSVVRGGRPLIGVVMGGSNARWRDDRMITLLNTGYTVLASRGQQRSTIYAQNLPRSPEGKATTAQQAASGDEALRSATAAASVDGVVDTENAGGTEMADASAPSSPFAAVEETSTEIVAAKNNTIAVAKAPPAVLAAAAPATKGKPPPLAKSKLPEPLSWGIQIGAYSTKPLAEKAVKQAKLLADSSLKRSKTSINGIGKKTVVHRARLENISEVQARLACGVLISKNSPCFVYRAGTKNL